MKKFYGLKMAFAVLVAGAAFVSCSDSDAGDIYIPNNQGGGTTPTVVPDAQYGVNGVVVDAEDGLGIADVEVTGPVSTTTNESGYFETGLKSSPEAVSGTYSFAKDGYASVNRTVLLSNGSKGQVVTTSLMVVMSAENQIYDIPGTTPTSDVANAVVVEPDVVATLVNNTDAEIQVPVTVTLPYGAIIPETKDLKDAVRSFVKEIFGNDPFEGFEGLLQKQQTIVVKLLAHTKATKLELIPIVRHQRVNIITEEGTFQQDLDVYYGEVEQALDTVPADAHDVHNGDNVGGGEGGGL